ncbi:uncharacterized protein VP01_4836g2, partial [Puccinia sorghi]
KDCRALRQQAASTLTTLMITPDSFVEMDQDAEKLLINSYPSCASVTEPVVRKQICLGLPALLKLVQHRPRAELSLHLIQHFSCDDNRETPERPVEPKIVKHVSKIGMQISSLLSTVCLDRRYPVLFNCSSYTAPLALLNQSAGPTDFLPNRPSLEVDPHRMICAKVGPDETNYHHQPTSFGESLTSPSPPPSAHDPSPAISIERPHLTGSQTAPAVTTIIHSPSTTTESSLPFTQSSSGVSCASSEGWSDMPVTPPNPLVSMGPSSRSGICKSHLSNPLKGVETFLDLPSGPPMTAPLLNPILLPSTTVIKVQTATIISEETMYGSPSAISQPVPSKSPVTAHGTSPSFPTPSDSGGLESALSGSKAKKGKEKEREKEKQRREKAAAVATARLREEPDRELSLMTRTGRKLESVRLISFKSPVIECWWQSSVAAMDQDDGEGLSSLSLLAGGVAIKEVEVQLISPRFISQWSCLGT